MVLSPIRLQAFLSGLNVSTTEPPPLVHSTKAQNIYEIANEGVIKRTPCKEFTNEMLCYCFVGRPAYKWAANGKPQWWELPLVFVIEFDNDIKIQRVFPFDSGAFKRKLAPSYISSFPIENYQITASKDHIAVLISAFYGNITDYFDGRPISRDNFTTYHEIGPRHMEIEALCELYNDPSIGSIDDRSSAIEVQLNQDLPLEKGRVLGVVMPSELKRDKELIDRFSKCAQRVHFYDSFPINIASYTALIYTEVKNIVKQCGGI